MSKITAATCSPELCQSFLTLQTELLGRLKLAAYRMIRSSGLNEGHFMLNMASLSLFMNADMFAFGAGTSDLELIYEANIEGKFYRVQATASCFRGSIDVDAMLFCHEEDHWLCYARNGSAWVHGPGEDYFDALRPVSPSLGPQSRASAAE